MKLSIFFFLLLGLVTQLCAEPEPPKSGRYLIQFYQNKKEIKAENGVLKLKKEAFSIKVTLINMQGVFLNASFKSRCFDLKDSEAMDQYSDIPGKVMVESTHNSDEELLLSNEYYSYWFYNSEDEFHRFDKEVELKGKKIIAQHTVSEFLKVGYVSGAIPMPIEDIENDIYLVFFGMSKDKDGEYDRDYARTKFKLIWN